MRWGLSDHFCIVLTSLTGWNLIQIYENVLRNNDVGCSLWNQIHSLKMYSFGFFSFSFLFWLLQSWKLWWARCDPSSRLFPSLELFKLVLANVVCPKFANTATAAQLWARPAMHKEMCMPRLHWPEIVSTVFLVSGEEELLGKYSLQWIFFPRVCLLCWLGSTYPCTCRLPQLAQQLESD